MLNIDRVKDKVKKAKSYFYNLGCDIYIDTHEDKNDKSKSDHLLFTYSDKLYIMLILTDNDIVNCLELKYYEHDDEEFENGKIIAFRNDKDISEIDFNYFFKLLKNRVQIDEIQSVFHKDNCPICGEKLMNVIGGDDDGYHCENECYSHVESYDIDNREEYEVFFIFDDNVFIYTNESERTKKHKLNVVRNLIKQWKENEKYMMKIMSGNKYKYPWSSERWG